MLGTPGGPLEGFWLGQWLYKYGEISVDLFFVISGFVFTHIYLGDHSQFPPINFRRFFVARMARLYPLHIATAIFIFLLAPYYSYADWPGNPADGYHLLLHSLFLQVSGLGEMLSLNRPTWSLSIEMFCYFWFVVSARSGIDNFRKMALALVLFGLTLSLFNSQILLNIGRGLFGFFIGCLTYENRRLLEKAPMLLLPLAFLFWVLISSRLHPGIIASATAWPALVIFAPRFKLLRFRFLTWLGERSYSIYLLHAPVYILLSGIMFDNRPPPDNDTVTICILGVIITLIISDLSYRYFEGPSRRYLNRIFAVPLKLPTYEKILP